MEWMEQALAPSLCSKHPKVHFTCCHQREDRSDIKLIRTDIVLDLRIKYFVAKISLNLLRKGDEKGEKKKKRVCNYFICILELFTSTYWKLSLDGSHIKNFFCHVHLNGSEAFHHGQAAGCPNFSPSRLFLAINNALSTLGS